MPRIIWTSGVYCFLNLVNQKRYVGSSYNLWKRTGTHLWDLENAKHPNTHLQRSWNKHGIENFVVLYLEQCPVDELLKREQHYIDLFKSANKHYGYNRCPIAGSPRGIKQSEETRRKKSEALKGFVFSEERNRKISIALTGKTHSEESRRKIGEASRGRKASQETLRKRSEGIKRSWLHRSRTVSDAVRQTLSDAHKGVKLSKSHAESISKSLKGIPKSEEHTRNAAAANRGRRFSASHKQNLKLAWVRRRLRCL